MIENFKVVVVASALTAHPLALFVALVVVVVCRVFMTIGAELRRGFLFQPAGKAACTLGGGVFLVQYEFVAERLEMVGVSVALATTSMPVRVEVVSILLGEFVTIDAMSDP
ncbi:hypothetical protein NJB14197_09030 [Mycobacterium montefiorense]|uniref:Uncharacterized protein n=1 Tax=Mycobacterium montefiorense TaxID=154654 RepID=A0AA37PMF0_9MYCO|nr:hypothetical protein MmonteBS_12220 [Mycobacterium montefiorense]GKU37757.1 hypothetical protein NJB14191_51030 [Mycobacterium montefiorense]GKU42715.1 hypothetical protein NJB14192_46980 [Mycobacterium montefiorense]GKU46409.1 hypothetical protein NJB14194_30280 [Mycobacterium montefiorense]GKU51008.1 hypothetical protein NJB14195_22540 [Mycobacterium montefiorense]